MQSALSAMPGRMPQGVDLNLNQFALDTWPQQAEGHLVSGPLSNDTCAAMATAFWSCIDGESSPMFAEEDHKLLQHIYNPSLSDRRLEGDRFSPPCTSLNYINKLRGLVNLEEEVRQQRQDHFFGIKFFDDTPGPLFPSAWTSQLAIARSKAAKQSGTLQPRKHSAAKTEQVMKSGPPVFQKKTEDGMTWRIYRVGSLEVRTTQEYSCEEYVGAVFSVREKTHLRAGRAAMGHAKILKATEYVEKAPQVAQDAESIECRYYVVFETEHGSKIVTEQLHEGTSWEENLVDLEDRNSLAKVVRAATTRQAGVTVDELKCQQAKFSQEHSNAGDHRSRSYATSMFVASLGGMPEAIEAVGQRRKELEAKSGGGFSAGGMLR
jgi:hypothetical protein